MTRLIGSVLYMTRDEWDRLPYEDKGFTRSPGRLAYTRREPAGMTRTIIITPEGEVEPQQPVRTL